MPIDPRTIKESEHASVRARVRITTLDVTQRNNSPLIPLSSEERFGGGRGEGGL